MSIQLRPNQQNLINEVRDILSITDEVCIAGSVGSGKTVIAMGFVETTPGLFYIQTFGQNVILDMWTTRMKESMSPEAIARTTIGLPHSYSKKDKKKYDYIIIDEAHQFTEAEMTQAIIKENPQAKLIYLTATPSPFVLKGTPIVCISGLELFKQGYSSDVYIGCASTTTKITKDDRNTALNVSTEALDQLHANIPADMNKLYEGIIQRLKNIEILKARPVLSKKLTWVNTFATLHKTIFFCESIKQSEEVLKFLTLKKVKSVISHSKNDPDSENIKAFQNDSSIKVLVVVDRAQAGFDMQELVNVVDMTFTHNPNRLYQMYGRVTRKSPKHDLKYFFKITNQEDIFVTKFYLNVMVNMLDEKFITKFNGKNLNEMEIPVRGSTKKVREEKDESESEELNDFGKVKTYKLDEDLFDFISVNDHFKMIESNLGGEFNEFAYTKISEIKQVEFNDIIHDVIGKKQLLLEMAKNGDRRPSSNLTKIGASLVSYTSNKSESFDEPFSNELRQLRPDWFQNRQEKQKQLSFEKMMKTIPSFVKFKEGQVWKGTKEKYIFICRIHGQFEGIPGQLVNSWKKKLSGHPTMSKQRVTEFNSIRSKLQKGQLAHNRRKVKNLNTNQVFLSVKLAAKSVNREGSTLSEALQNSTKCGGYNWEYVDE